VPARTEYAHESVQRERHQHRHGKHVEVDGECAHDPEHDIVPDATGAARFLEQMNGPDEQEEKLGVGPRAFSIKHPELRAREQHRNDHGDQPGVESAIRHPRKQQQGRASRDDAGQAQCELRPSPDTEQRPRVDVQGDRRGFREIPGSSLPQGGAAGAVKGVPLVVEEDLRPDIVVPDGESDHGDRDDGDDEAVRSCRPRARRHGKSGRSITVRCCSRYFRIAGGATTSIRRQSAAVSD
jgi:hypothetical protein